MACAAVSTSSGAWRHNLTKKERVGRKAAADAAAAAGWKGLYCSIIIYSDQWAVWVDFQEPNTKDKCQGPWDGTTYYLNSTVSLARAARQAPAGAKEGRGTSRCTAWTASAGRLRGGGHSSAAGLIIFAALPTLAGRSCLLAAVLILPELA